MRVIEVRSLPIWFVLVASSIASAHPVGYYEIGARFVLAATRAYRDPRDWTATLGLEVEPVGALRYLLGIRSWY